MPAEDICIRKLNKNNPEFCAVKYNAEKPSASEQKIDPSKMRISQLKSYLAEHGTKCTGCYEKSGRIVLKDPKYRLCAKGEGGDGSRIVKWVYFFWMFVVFTGLEMLAK